MTTYCETGGKSRHVPITSHLGLAPSAPDGLSKIYSDAPLGRSHRSKIGKVQAGFDAIERTRELLEHS